jgi:uncharacterized protein (TIGR02217 family)
MAFLETPRFPGCVSFGALGGPMFSTVRTVVSSGFDDVLIRYEQPLHKYTFEHANRTQIEHDELREFFMAVKGMGHRFRVKDYSDYTVTQAQSTLQGLHSGVPVGTFGEGWGTPSYLLQKKYTAGALTTYRNIYKPVAGTVQVFRDGVQLVVGAGPGEIAIDTTMGKITFVADQTKTIVSHVVGNPHRINVTTVFSPQVAIGQRIFITGVTGTAADLLNNLSHEITNFGTTDIYIDTDTTGLSAASGTAWMYPQETSDVLTWSGEFDVPCRFLSDEASYEIVDRMGHEGGLLYSWSGINLTEVRVSIT